jgi:hypothetical protein
METFKQVRTFDYIEILEYLEEILIQKKKKSFKNWMKIFFFTKKLID